MCVWQYHNHSSAAWRYIKDNALYWQRKHLKPLYLLKLLSLQTPPLSRALRCCSVARINGRSRICTSSASLLTLKHIQHGVHRDDTLPFRAHCEQCRCAWNNTVAHNKTQCVHVRKPQCKMSVHGIEARH
mmetsp:Transcript_38180/g.110258  ORF Transcript_38180/g.110258 Transcript_38180/m.110258 type:complete len:130 (+) Transcript_38180:380-769(+)